MKALEGVRRLAAATPSDRDRVVDAIRAASIGVVVIWHWSLSITHRDADGRLVNPNPIDDVPLGWAATWVLQVMPVFFIVGGFANGAGWRSTAADGGNAATFLRARARRLLGPTLAFVAVWALIDGGAFLLVDGHRSFVVSAPLVFVPLWFVGAYLWVVALVPITARWHDRAPRATLAALLATVLIAEMLRFGTDIGPARWINTALVWVVVHQLGYFWCDGTLTRWRPARLLGLAAAGLAAVAVATSLDIYPRSLVGTTGAERSHMYPTTAVIVPLAITQLGIVLAFRPRLSRWLQRSGPWTAVVALNAVIMTVFVWHMTALFGLIVTLEAVGVELGADPTFEWWLARPFWILAPAIALVPLVAAFSWIETGTSGTDDAQDSDRE